MASAATRLGGLIRRQREMNELTLRELADRAGISNPYLSQIERGLREPSERVVTALARSLGLPVDEVLREAGFGDDAEPPSTSVEEAIRADPRLTQRQRRALLDVYQALVGGQSR
ncbi:MAG: helix-turn-helix domain-containing protein [Thermoleophilaceae bacterium]